jgi:hypothetical protein
MGSPRAPGRGNTLCMGGTAPARGRRRRPCGGPAGSGAMHRCRAAQGWRDHPADHEAQQPRLGGGLRCSHATPGANGPQVILTDGVAAVPDRFGPVTHGDALAERARPATPGLRLSTHRCGWLQRVATRGTRFARQTGPTYVGDAVLRWSEAGRSLMSSRPDWHPWGSSYMKNIVFPTRTTMTSFLQWDP